MFSPKGWGNDEKSKELWIVCFFESALGTQQLEDLFLFFLLGRAGVGWWGGDQSGLLGDAAWIWVMKAVVYLKSFFMREAKKFTAICS